MGERWLRGTWLVPSCLRVESDRYTLKVEWNGKAGAQLELPPARPSLDWSDSVTQRTCSVEGCGRSDRLKLGLCSKHYQRFKRTGSVELTTVYPEFCTVEGCNRPYMAKGLCTGHYDRLKTGRPVEGPLRPVGLTMQDRFWSKVDKNGPEPAPDTLAAQRGLGNCWVWTGRLSHGYGVIQIGTLAMPTTVLAHRLAWEMENGRQFPKGLEPDHLCRRPSCMKPLHLEPVTHRENMLRGNTFAARQAARTHCPQGHEYSPENTYVSRNGSRSCRACASEAARRRTQS